MGLTMTFRKILVGLLWLAVGVFAVAARAVDITGAGATFPYPIYAKWAEAYKARNRLLFPTEVQVKCSSMRLLHWYGFLSNRRSFRPWCNVSDL